LAILVGNVPLLAISGSVIAVCGLLAEVRTADRNRSRED
jgi:hypothetical protein